MTDDKKPMQADGRESRQAEAAVPPSAGRQDIQENTGQSGGGAYPNPYDQEHGNPQQDGGFHGGQSIMGYHGKGQLGSEKLGTTENAPTEED